MTKRKTHRDDRGKGLYAQQPAAATVFSLAAFSPGAQQVVASDFATSTSSSTV
jgi:hypothetical protein